MMVMFDDIELENIVFENALKLLSNTDLDLLVKNTKSIISRPYVRDGIKYKFPNQLPEQLINELNRREERKKVSDRK